MAERVVLFWRDIPAQVVVKAGRTRSAKRELSRRFIETIDRVAMREDLSETDDYLQQWRRGTPEPCGDDLDGEATVAAADLEARYTDEVLKQLAAQGGWAAPK